jgi:hypothetical protein
LSYQDSHTVDLSKIYADLQQIDIQMKEDEKRLLQNLKVSSFTHEHEIVYIDSQSGQLLPYEEYESRYSDFIKNSIPSPPSTYSSPRSPAEMSESSKSPSPMKSALAGNNAVVEDNNPI